ncbi:unnamed protein product [Gordionus sp. m RMFG-2023]
MSQRKYFNIKVQQFKLKKAYEGYTYYNFRRDDKVTKKFCTLLETQQMVWSQQRPDHKNPILVLDGLLTSSLSLGMEFPLHDTTLACIKKKLQNSKDQDNCARFQELPALNSHKDGMITLNSWSQQ